MQTTFKISIVMIATDTLQELYQSVSYTEIVDACIGYHQQLRSDYVSDITGVLSGDTCYTTMVVAPGVYSFMQFKIS